MLDYAEHDLLAQVAAMYYLEEMTQDAIAAQLGVSRIKVYRLLKQAREEQVIQFTINWPVQRAPEVEAQLCSVFNLREALVLRPSSPDRSHALARVGQLGARYLEQILHDGMVMTVWFKRGEKVLLKPLEESFPEAHEMAKELEAFFFTATTAEKSDFAEDEIAFRWIKRHADSLVLVRADAAASGSELYEAMRIAWHAREEV